MPKHCRPGPRVAPCVQTAEAIALDERNLADYDVLTRRDSDSIKRLSAAVKGPVPIVVPQLDEDVQDLLGLGRVAEHLFE